MTKVKICGITDRETAQVAVDAGADYLGFVFADSKRHVTEKTVTEITKNLPAKVLKVGVFVSPTVTELQTAVREAKLDLIQLHGRNPCEGSHFDSVPIIHALNGEMAGLAKTLAQSRSAYQLLDASIENQRYAGGNGQTFDWRRLSLEAHQMLRQKSCFIAGGLTPENVVDAIRIFQPFAVDVSSGVETNGKKDHQKIHAFIQAVKEEKYVSAT